MRKPIIIGVVAVLFVVTAAYSYVSPRLTLKSIAEAAKANDADRLRDLVDFPLVRENLKESMKVTINKKMANDTSMKDNPFAGLGMMLGNMMVDKMVDAFVSPAGIAGALQAKGPQATATATKETFNVFSDGDDGKVSRQMHYDSYERFLFKVSATDKPQAAFVFVLKRSGLFSWRLTEVRLPDLDV